MLNTPIASVDDKPTSMFQTRTVARVIKEYDWSVPMGALRVSSVVLVRDCNHTAYWAGPLSEMPKVGDSSECNSCPTVDGLELVTLPGGSHAWLRAEQ